MLRNRADEIGGVSAGCVECLGGSDPTGEQVLRGEVGRGGGLFESLGFCGAGSVYDEGGIGDGLRGASTLRDDAHASVGIVQSVSSDEWDAGKPLIWMDDPESWEWILGNWEAVWRGAGVEAGDCALFPFSFGPFLGFWAGFEAAARMGVRAVPGGGMSSEDRLGLLERCGANVLCCTPTYAIRLAEVGEAMGKSVADLGVKTIVVCGEPGGSIPAVRERIEAAWQAKVVDHHGMTEIGPVTVSDEENADWLRVLHFSYHAEVIDPETLAPVELGEVGELVLTTLGRFGAPLLRYRTGDLVKPVAVPGGDPAAFVLEGGIIGRSDDMVVVRGVNIYPSAVDAVVRGCEGIGEYQVEVDQRAALPELLIRVEGGEAEAKGLERALRQAFWLADSGGGGWGREFAGV